MTTLKTKLTTAFATGAVLLQALAPLAAAETLQITGNGAGSDSAITANQTNTTALTQTNTANVVNNVKVDADSGKNKANFNTGGDVNIQTGPVNVGVGVVNDLNTNVASIDCCAANGGSEVIIGNNGAFSDNTANLNKTNTITAAQNNTANVVNDVDVDADSGKNKANLNTNGDVTIVTGPVDVAVVLETTANRNLLNIGGQGAGVHDNDVSLQILGNGAGSDNLIGANFANVVAASQANTANIVNDVDVDADTGKNDASFNTGGDVTIASGFGGGADVVVSVDNNVNFNAADIDCGCVWDVTAKIANNGASAGLGYGEFWWLDLGDTDNTIAGNFTNTQAFGQANFANLANDLDEIDAHTGKNDASLNVGAGVASDPSVTTGPAKATVVANNEGNVNVFGDASLPWTDVNVNFNANALLALFSWFL